MNIQGYGALIIQGLGDSLCIQMVSRPLYKHHKKCYLMTILYGLKHVGVSYFDISNSKKTYCAFGWLLKILIKLGNVYCKLGATMWDQVHMSIFFNLAKCSQVMSISEYIL